jgi:riboflavin kinase/FMN adenylyltransferase
VLEAYLLDFQGDLYGESARVSFVERLRDDRRFESADALVTQMHRDVDEARALLDADRPGGQDPASAGGSATALLE